MMVRGRLTRADLAVGLGMLSPQLVAAFARHGATVSAVIAASARRFGDDVAVVDGQGELSYRRLDALVSAAASGLQQRERIGVICTSTRWLLVAIAATSRAGADAVLINPKTGATELDGIVARERITRLLRDDDVAARADAPAARPARGGRIVLLSSGTTGVPVSTSRASLRLPSSPPRSAWSRQPGSDAASRCSCLRRCTTATGSASPWLAWRRAPPCCSVATCCLALRWSVVCPRSWAGWPTNSTRARTFVA